MFPLTVLFVPVVVVEVPIDQLSEPTPIPTLSAPTVVFVDGLPNVLYGVILNVAVILELNQYACLAYRSAVISV